MGDTFGGNVMRFRKPVDKHQGPKPAAGRVIIQTGRGIVIEGQATAIERRRSGLETEIAMNVSTIRLDPSVYVADLIDDRFVAALEALFPGVRIVLDDGTGVT